MKQARREEIRYFKSISVYEKVELKERWDETGRGAIAVRWVDINNGDRLQNKYRSRLVTKKYNTGERPEWFAATTSTECLKILLSKMASNRKLDKLHAEVPRAYFYAAAMRL